MTQSRRETTLNLAGSPSPGNRAAGEVGGANRARVAAAADAIHTAHEHWIRGFEEITRRAHQRFERRDWRGAQADATARLALYRIHLDGAVADVRDILEDAVLERTLWAAVKARHSEDLAGRPDAEVAQTFFNSVTRRIFSTVGADPAIEYLDPSTPPGASVDSELVERHVAPLMDAAVARRMLEAYRWSVPYAQLDRDAEQVAAIVRDRLAESEGTSPVTIEMLRPVFFRNKGAYLVGRVLRGDLVLPIVLPLIHAERGIVVDAVLMTENEASVVFGFSWSYFRVAAPRPRAMVEFLRSIMPLKRVDELYTAIGFNKHGKTELYRSLMQDLERPEARFAFAEGDEGMVMAVFMLPSFNTVFKIIKDSFGAPKNTTRQAVMDKYHFVFVRDRVGRLADAQEFEHLEFPRRCFPDDLLGYLLSVAGATVRVEGDRVIIRQLYTERRVTPLNLFLRGADQAAACEAVLDYGNAIKDLAAADIFTGDMLLKNFGVTRHGRVICYDYDELCLLSECRFRRLPQPSSIEEEFAAEPWFHVGEMDVFPEEFRAFLVPAGRVRDAFLTAHGDLLDVELWQGVQRRLAAGEVFDVFPYRRSARLRRDRDR
ncbi:MAG TPA: bifunctional isocitrate dehydrogenase kinase/phosphatase [Gemmatimonadales bacterium]|nr:bifunctional isocitrate dehydrogenase kinase/phosphatase [Gemmatimonadales bacterium]